MHRVIHVFLLFLFTTSLNAQKVYWRTSYAKMNEPLGGVKQVKEMVYKELVYPSSSLLESKEGTVVIAYQLPGNGIPEITSIKGINDQALRDETIRLFRMIRFKKASNRPFSADSESFQITYSKKAWVKLHKKRGYMEIAYPHQALDTSAQLYSYQLLRDKPYPLFSKKESYRGFNDYIKQKLEYPEDALRLGLKGEVVISFVIEKSGNISNVEVVKDLGAGCTQEALRLINSLRWYPGVKDEKAVRTMMVSSIGFGQASNAFQDAFNQGGSTGR